MSRYFIIGNFGDPSVALLQWVIESGLEDVTFLAVDTSWSAKGWDKRVSQCRQYAEKNEVAVEILQAKQSFSEMVSERRQFPSVKFQWCAGFLKGLILNEFLDEADPFCEAVLLFGKQAVGSRSNQLLTEKIEESEHYDGRTLLFPLLGHSSEQLTSLIKKTGLGELNHRSLECEPCIHASLQDFSRMHADDITRLAGLEKAIGKSMFENNIIEMNQNNSIEQPLSYQEQFDMGCGSVWGCGE